MNDGEKLASYAITFTSIAALIIAIIELPTNPSAFNVLVAILVSAIIAAAFVSYKAGRRTFPNVEEEQRLIHAFPSIYAFLESIDSIRGESDFTKLEAQLNQLIEAEKRSRSIRWKEMQEIEAIRGIALAKLVQKKRFKS